jgi:hypothetical protein
LVLFRTFFANDAKDQHFRDLSIFYWALMQLGDRWGRRGTKSCAQLAHTNEYILEKLCTGAQPTYCTLVNIFFKSCATGSWQHALVKIYLKGCELGVCKHTMEKLFL